MKTSSNLIHIQTSIKWSILRLLQSPLMSLGIVISGQMVSISVCAIVIRRQMFYLNDKNGPNS